MGASAGGEGGGGMPDPALLQGGLNMLTACGGPTALPAVLTILPDVMASMDNFTALQKSSVIPLTNCWSFAPLLWHTCGCESGHGL